MEVNQKVQIVQVNGLLVSLTTWQPITGNQPTACQFLVQYLQEEIFGLERGPRDDNIYLCVSGFAMPYDWHSLSHASNTGRL